MNLLRALFHRLEADAAERETAVVTAQLNGRRDRDRELAELREHIPDTHPDYPAAVERRRQTLGR